MTWRNPDCFKVSITTMKVNKKRNLLQMAAVQTNLDKNLYEYYKKTFKEMKIFRVKFI